VDISPNEKFIVSFNGTINDAPNTENYIIWNLRTAEKIRSFKAERLEVWGAFQWSYDSNFLARLNQISSTSEELQLSVYKMPLCDMIQDAQGKKNSIKVPGLQKFAWVENSTSLCCVSFGGNKAQNPTKVTLMEVATKIFYLKMEY